MTDTEHRSDDQAWPDISGEECARITEALLEQGREAGEFLGLGGQDLEAMYHIAFHTYESGGYAQAEKIFGLLCLLHSREITYWLGLGNCRQMLDRHVEALAAYHLAALLDDQDTRPLMQSAVSWIALGERDAAGEALDAALARSEAGRADAALVRERAATLRQWLEAPAASATN